MSAGVRNTNGDGVIVGNACMGGGRRRRGRECWEVTRAEEIEVKRQEERQRERGRKEKEQQ